MLVIIAAVGVWYGLSRKDASTTSQEGVRVSYACRDDKTISATIYPGEAGSVEAGEQPVPGGSAKVELSDGRDMTLAQTISASGVRYANSDESFVFWTQGNGALVLENNEEQSYIGCVRIAEVPSGSNLNEVYSNSEEGFSLRLPSLAFTAGENDSYVVDESFRNQQSPEKVLAGVRFTIPRAKTEGTNLSSDTYFSIESIPQTATCTADLFFDGGHATTMIEENGQQYSVASSSNAGAGNRYEEIVYAIPGTNPCVAMRYLIHHTAIQNYEPGTVEELDMEALLQEFDQIRSTLILNQ